MNLTRIVSFVLFGIMVILLGFLAIIAYDFYFAESQIFNVFQEDTGPLVNLNASDEFPNGILFYDGLRFPSHYISYSIDLNCNENRMEDSRKAFEVLQANTILNFNEIPLNGDIEVSCSEKEIFPDEEYFIAGEGGPNSIVNTTVFYVIGNGTMFLYEDNKCSEPIVAIHEILHVIGFKHSVSKDSIMYEISNCKQKITSDIINTINTLYDIPPLPDLVVKEVNAEKKGKYLTFSVEVLNSGLYYSRDTFISVYADNLKVIDYELDRLEVGSGRIITVRNLKIPRSTDKISFIIDDVGLLFEISKDNNLKVLTVN